MTAPPWHETSAGNGRGRWEEGTDGERGPCSRSVCDRVGRLVLRLPNLKVSRNDRDWGEIEDSRITARVEWMLR
jgi:hypothetical protein